MIKAVLFDVFETLVTERGRDIPRASSLGETLGLDGAAFRTAWKARRPHVVSGRLSFREALLDIGARLNVALDAAVVERVCDERVRAKRAIFDGIEPDVVAMIRDLLQRDTRLAAVSNCFAEDVEAWSGCVLASQFACAVFSFAIGVAKPDPEIYLEAVRRLSVDPVEALFVGDGAGDELHGAERAGLRAAHAAWFVNSEINHPASTIISCVSSPGDVLALVAAGSRRP
jgi:HAD superfamily hydrolase (TIGR01549 family)